MDKRDFIGFIFFIALAVSFGAGCAFTGDAFYGIMGIAEGIIAINFLDMAMRYHSP